MRDLQETKTERLNILNQIYEDERVVEVESSFRTLLLHHVCTTVLYHKMRKTFAATFRETCNRSARISAFYIDTGDTKAYMCDIE